MDFIVDEIIQRLCPGAQIVFRGNQEQAQGSQLYDGIALYVCQFFKGNVLVAVAVPPHLGKFRESLTNDDKLEAIEAIVAFQIGRQLSPVSQGVDL